MIRVTQLKSVKGFNCLAIALLALCSFLYMAKEVTGNRIGDTFWLRTDAAWSVIFDLHRTNELTSVMTTFTYLGSTISLTIVSGVALIFLHFKNQTSGRRVLLGAVLLSFVLIQSAKYVFGRIRPDASNWLVPEAGLSFPSGHTTASTALVGILFYVLGREVNSRKEKLTLWSIGFLIIAMIALSRIYLGVHFPTDVLGGILLGSFILFLSIAIDEFQKKKNL